MASPLQSVSERIGTAATKGFTTLNSLANVPTRPVPTAALLPFTLITFAISLGFLGLCIFFPKSRELVRRHHREASGLCARRLGVGFRCLCGGADLRRHPGCSRLPVAPGSLALFRRMSPVPATRHSACLRCWRGGQGLAALGPLAFDSLGAALSAMLFMLFLGPVEEFGWRGVAWHCPSCGATWGLWHLPAFYLSGTVQSGWGFAPFFVGNVCLSLIVTPLLNASRGSILWPALFRFQVNNPLWPDAQPYDTYFFAGAAVLVVWINRRTMLRRDGAVTEVFAPHNQARSSP